MYVYIYIYIYIYMYIYIYIYIYVTTINKYNKIYIDTPREAAGGRRRAGGLGHIMRGLHNVLLVSCNIKT